MALSLADPVMRDFAFYSTASVFKMFEVTGLTVYRRMTQNVFMCPEDYGPSGKDAEKTMVLSESVERARRNHMNDMENIIPFILVGGFYVLTKPDHKTALWHFRIFFLSRVLHTISYQAGVQPWRGLSWFVGLGSTFSMMYHVFRATYQ